MWPVQYPEIPLRHLPILNTMKERCRARSLTLSGTGPWLCSTTSPSRKGCSSSGRRSTTILRSLLLIPSWILTSFHISRIDEVSVLNKYRRIINKLLGFHQFHSIPSPHHLPSPVRGGHAQQDVYCGQTCVGGRPELQHQDVGNCTTPWDHPSLSHSTLTQLLVRCSGILASKSILNKPAKTNAMALVRWLDNIMKMGVLGGYLEISLLTMRKGQPYRNS